MWEFLSTILSGMWLLFELPPVDVVFVLNSIISEGGKDYGVVSGDHRSRLEISRVSLFRVVRVVFSRGLLVLNIAYLFTLITTICTGLDLPICRTGICMLPPGRDRVIDFGANHSGGSSLDPFAKGSVCSIFLQGLRSRSLGQDFFTSACLKSLDRSRERLSRSILCASFSSELAILPPNGSLISQCAITFRTCSPGRTTS